MHSLGSIVGNQCTPARSHGRKYRQDSRFVLDPRTVSTKLDRNAKVRLLVQVEILERETKGRGRRNGLASLIGLVVLRALLLQHHNRETGICNPSYATLQRRTGLCRASIAAALQRLEAIGVLGRIQRLVRVVDERGAVCVRQAANLYRFAQLPARVPIPIWAPAKRSRVYPAARLNHTGANRRQEKALGAGFSLASIMERRSKAGMA